MLTLAGGIRTVKYYFDCKSCLTGKMDSSYSVVTQISIFTFGSIEQTNLVNLLSDLSR